MSQTEDQKKKPPRDESPEETRARRDIDDLRQVLNLEAGRRLFWRYFGIAGIFETSFDPAASPETTFFNEGKRAVGTTMLNDMMKVAPHAFVKCLDDDIKGRN